MLPFLLDSLIFKNPRWIHHLIYLQFFINQGLHISFTGLLIGWHKRAHVFCWGSAESMVHASQLLQTCSPSLSLLRFVPSPAHGIFVESWKQMRPSCAAFAQDLLTCNHHASRWACLATSNAQSDLFVSLGDISPFPFLLISHKSCQDAQESFCGLPCGSRGCQRIKYKIKLLFFPFHTRAIHSTERDAAASPRAPRRAVKYWYSN